MEVTRINPQGFCKGVTLAIKKCVDAIKNSNNPRPIYLLGMLIHNETVCEALKNEGIILVDEKGKTRYEMLEKIESGTVIFSAHGVSQRVYDLAKEKNLTIVDASCPDVLKVHQNTRKYLGLGYEVLYIGTKGHPECEGILEESNKIHLITSSEDFANLDKNKAYYITNQTTLALEEIETIYDEIRKEFSNTLIENDICQATTQRQNALFGKTSDVIFVVGDFRSSNTNKLIKIAKEKANSKAVYGIETLFDLKDIPLHLYQSAIVTSGASTPKAITDQVIEYLKNYPEKKSFPETNVSEKDLLLFL